MWSPKHNDRISHVFGVKNCLMHEAQIWAQKMPSGKRQLRSASSESRNTASPLASGTYVRKETPGGLQSRKFLFQNQRVNVSMVLIKVHMHHQFFGYCRAYFGNFLKFGTFDHCLNWSSKFFCTISSRPLREPCTMLFHDYFL